MKIKTKYGVIIEEGVKIKDATISEVHISINDTDSIAFDIYFEFPGEGWDYNLLALLVRHNVHAYTMKRFLSIMRFLSDEHVIYWNDLVGIKFKVKIDYEHPMPLVLAFGRHDTDEWLDVTWPTREKED